MTVWSVAIMLFLVIDPFGNIPIFLAAMRTVPPERHTRVMVRELLVALVILLAFLFAGPGILKSLGISGPSLTVGGGVILFLIALRMVLPLPAGHPDAPPPDEPFIVPLAIPYVAGPSTIATVLFLTSREPTRRWEWLVALLVAWAASSAIILGASRLRHIIGDRGLTALERLMGMVLVAVSVQMMMNGLAQWVGTL
jgi:multiple antibiotic resistance protein